MLPLAKWQMGCHEAKLGNSYDSGGKQQLQANNKNVQYALYITIFHRGIDGLQYASSQRMFE
jgi:hypothetical protein